MKVVNESIIIIIIKMFTFGVVGETHAHDYFEVISLSCGWKMLKMFYMSYEWRMLKRKC